MTPDAFLPNAETVAAVEKDVATYNQRRIYEQAQLGRRRPAIITIYVVAFLAIAYLIFLSGAERRFLFVGMLGAVAVGLWPQLDKQIMKSANWTRQNFRDHVLPVMFGFIPELRYAHGIEPRSFGRMPKAILPGHNRRTFDDVLSGTIEGARFELFEMKLIQRSKNSTTTTFEGAVLHCKLTHSFPGTLLATRKVGDFNRFFRDLFGTGGLIEIASSNDQLDRLYELRTDARGAAREMLAGRLGAVLESVWKSWPNDTAQLGIVHDDVFVMLPSPRNCFELPAIEDELDYHAHVEPMVRQIASFLSIAAQLRSLDGALAPPPENG